MKYVGSYEAKTHLSRLLKPGRERRNYYHHPTRETDRSYRSRRSGNAEASPRWSRKCWRIVTSTARPWELT